MRIEEFLRLLGLGNPSERAAMHLATHNFQQPPMEVQIANQKGLAELIGMSDRIEAVFTVAVVKNPPNHHCDACGGSHPDGVGMFLLVSGEEDLVRSALLLAVNSISAGKEDFATITL